MSNGRFKKGSVPHNKGKTLKEYLSIDKIEKIRLTQFKFNAFVGKNHPSWRGGVQKNKIDCTYIWTGNKQRIRRPRKIYEEFIGKIPKGYVIYHKDGNKNHDWPSNLEAISRKELLKRNNS